MQDNNISLLPDVLTGVHGITFKWMIKTEITVQKPTIDTINNP